LISTRRRRLYRTHDSRRRTRGATSGRRELLCVPNGEQVVQNDRLLRTRTFPSITMRPGITTPQAAQTFT